MRAGERGESLVEVVVAAALAAVTLSAVLTAIAAAAHRFGPDPVAQALQQYVAREMRIAVDLLKYQGTNVPPAAIETTVPLAGRSPLPVHVTLSVVHGTSGTQLHISAQSDEDAREITTLQTSVAEPAPLPSSTVAAGSPAPAPVGAQ